MSFVNQLEALIAKATNEYDRIATSEPIISSKEDGTDRGHLLDEVIQQQHTEKKKLWSKLYKLEKQRIRSGKNKAFQEAPTTAAEKRLLTAMFESFELEKLIEREQKDEEEITSVNGIVAEILHKEQLEREIKEYDQTIDFLKAETEKARLTFFEEELALSETKKLNERLLQRKEVLIGMNPGLIADKMNDHLTVIQSMLKRDTKHLIGFLDEYYPPHAIDENDPLGEECELKKMLEHIMNQSYASPENPYLSLEPGTYWKPYIQTLAKAGIIRYNPENANEICLEDFSV
ncbi:hypothetical protein BY458DRAFT_442227 [Sporodiniella umbellata]|nr:hypothetical protein BY458DRAFT_442227 [Sporodiniella umbellata]